MTSNPRYSMLDSMDIRCSRCGYENSPQFRFCGMCGAPLRPTGTGRQEPAAPPIPIDRTPEEAAESMPVEPLLAQLTAAQKFTPQQTIRAHSPESFSPEAHPRESHSQESYSQESRQGSSPPEPAHGQRTPVPVTGPSFLGLSDSSDRGAEYLLEDEPHPGRRRAIFVSLLVLIAAGALIFYWRKAGYPWISHSGGQSASATLPTSPSPGDTSSDNTSTGSTTTPPSEVAPPMANQPKLEKPMTGVGDRPVPNDSGTAAAAPKQASPEKQEATNNEGAESSTSETQTSEEETSGNKAQNDATGYAEAPLAATPPKATPAVPRATRAIKTLPLTPAPADPAEDSLYLQGQKYLYGGAGVSANCARAQQYLMSSANNNNPKAESTLATMYATGHCVGKNLPLAYRWFARALHTDPRNTRLERDVEIMWNQMSSQEKQIALKSQ